MKYFVVEGTILDPKKMNDEVMKMHMSYTQKAMDSGVILTSGLKEDMSGGLFIIKSETIENVENYLNNEPFKVNGIQEYRIIEFNSHYVYPSSKEWFDK